MNDEDSYPLFLEQDENLKFLIHYQLDRPNVDVNQVVTMMTRFRKGLSFSWLSKFKPNSHATLKCVINLILKYTEHSDANVRVTAYSTLGGLLIAITPFAPRTFKESFAEAIKTLEVSSKLSIAVINMFMYLTRFVSPVRINSFIENVPVSFHFSVDVTDFIQYIPQTIPLMKNLPIELLQNILRSIVCTGGRKPNSSFTQTVVELVAINKKVLLDVVLNYIQANDLDSAAVWIGPYLFQDRENYEMAGESGRELFLQYALKEFSRKPLDLSQFEYACKICGIFLRYTSGTEEHAALKQRIQSHILDYPAIYKTRLLYMPCSLDQLEDNPKDYDSMRSARLNALASFFSDNLELESLEPDRIAEMFAGYKNAENDLYCTLVDSFAKCIDQMLLKCKGNAHIDLLRFILKKKNKNWVHDEAVSKFIDNIKYEHVCDKVPEYTDLVLDRLLEFTLSTNDRLFATSVTSIKQFASYDNLPNIIDRIFHSDWMNEHILSRRFALLGELCTLFIHRKIPDHPLFESDLFSTLFVDIAYESLLMAKNLSAISNIYHFLSYVPIDHLPDEIRIFSYRFLVKHYQLYTRNQVLGINPEYAVEVPKHFFLETIDTDIVINPTLNHKDALIHMKSCFGFLKKLPVKLLGDIGSLFIISTLFIPIFDRFAFKTASQLAIVIPGTENTMYGLAKATFLSTSNDEVASSCCEYFVKSHKPIEPIIERDVEQYLGVKATSDPKLLFLCFIIVDQKDHEMATQALPNIIDRLSTSDATVLLYKLSNVMGKIGIENMDEKYSIAMLEYANQFGGMYAERVRKYIEVTPYYEWPLDDVQMNQCLITFLANEPRIKISDYHLLDKKHWEFVIHNADNFELPGLGEFIKLNPSIFSKVDTSSFISFPKFVPKFNVTELHQPLVSSIAAMLAKGNFMENPALLRSFFETASFAITQELFEKILQYTLESGDAKLLDSLMTYARRYKLVVKDFTHPLFYNEESFFNSLRLIIKTSTISQLDETVRARIEEKVNHPLTPEFIHEDMSIMTNRAVVQIEPDYFIQYLKEQEEYRAHRYIPLCQLIPTISFSTDVLVEVVLKFISSFSQFTSARKKMVIIRTITTLLYTLHGQKKMDVIKSVCDRINEQLPNILYDQTSIIQAEISYLLKYFIQSNKDPKHIQTIFDYLRNISPTSTIFELQLEHITTLSINKHKNMPHLTDRTLKQILKTSSPSSMANALHSITTILKHGKIELFQTIYHSIDFVGQIFSQLAMQYKLDLSTCTFLIAILSRHKGQQIPVKFFHDFTQEFLAYTKRPTYTMALPLTPQLATFFPTIFSRLFEAPYGHEIITNAIETTYSTILYSLKSSEKKELYQIEVFEKALPFFSKHPTIYTGKLLYQVSKGRVDLASFFFMKQAQSATNFPVMYRLLIMIYNTIDEPVKDSIKMVIESSKFSPESRNKAMKLLVSDHPNKYVEGFLYATSETDNIEALENEISLVLK